MSRTVFIGGRKWIHYRTAEKCPAPTENVLLNNISSLGEFSILIDTLTHPDGRFIDDFYGFYLVFSFYNIIVVRPDDVPGHPQPPVPRTATRGHLYYSIGYTPALLKFRERK